jgi:hypothetical protein
MQIVGEQAGPLAVMPNDLQKIALAPTKAKQMAAMRICGVPHIRSYVSGVIMWRRAFAARYSATKPSFAAT